jgi:large subunit ribosomal protein L9
MKVVLLKDLPGKGRAGQIREVNNGYARNFLLPRGLALAATPAVIKQVESRMEKERLEESIGREKMAELAQQIEGQEIHLKARMGAGERLFGSVTAADVAEALSQSISSVVDKKRIDIEKPLRRAGSYEVVVKLASDIRPQITVVVEEEKEEAEQEEKNTGKKAEQKAEEQAEEEQEGTEEEKE